MIEFFAVRRDGLGAFDSSESDEESSEDDDEELSDELDAFSDSSDDELSTRAFLAFVGLIFRFDFLMEGFGLLTTFTSSSLELLELLSTFAFGSFFCSLKVTFCYRFSFSLPMSFLTMTSAVFSVTLVVSSNS